MVMSRAPKPIDPDASAAHRFGFTLRSLRTQARYSLQGFARRLGKSDSYLSAVELAQARCTLAFAADCDRLQGASGRLVGLWAPADREWEQRNRRHRTLLRRERLARGWTLQQTVDALKRLAHDRGYGTRLDGLDANAISRYEHGRIRRPHPPLPELFAALYQRPVPVLFPAVTEPTDAQAAELGAVERAATPHLPAEPLLPDEVERALDAIFAGLEAICHAGPVELAVVRRQVAHIVAMVANRGGGERARAS
jgi:transcriptional regulator with XRE-family HTH domain